MLTFVAERALPAPSKQMASFTPSPKLDFVDAPFGKAPVDDNVEAMLYDPKADPLAEMFDASDPAITPNAPGGILARLQQRLALSLLTEAFKRWNDVLDEMHVPKFNMTEGQDAFTLQIQTDTPDVDITVQGDLVTVSGSKTFDDGDGLSHTESFVESVSCVPRHVLVKNATSSYDEETGCVVITFPKEKTPQTDKIPARRDYPRSEQTRPLLISHGV